VSSTRPWRSPEAAAQEAGNDDITAVAQTLVDASEVLVAEGDRAGAEAAL
jgi:hypothetical protein